MPVSRKMKQGKSISNPPEPNHMYYFILINGFGDAFWMLATIIYINPQW
jgi:hypothetical protein